jgi:3-deoxy-7-phosphoheptulonate synthase
MNFTIIKKLPPVEDIIQEFPLSGAGHEKVSRDRQEVKRILAGQDERLLIIVGPCSAWPKEAVLAYAKKLKALEEKIKPRLKLVMRIYIQKPRTTKGWTGPVNQPDPLAVPDIAAGVRYTREMMVKILELGLPIADEALFTHNAKGFLELLSWVAIGARSSEDQEHRIFASAIDCAVGLKNPTHGSIEIGVNGVVAAQHPHVAVFDGHEVQTHGNPFAHLVLRGGAQGPNYSAAHIKEALRQMAKHRVKNPAIIIDTGHDNGKINDVKNHLNQISVAKAVMQELKQEPQLKTVVKGFMVESFLKAGCQKLDPGHPENLDQGGLSITDPCLSWEQTEKLLLDLAQS